MRMKKKIVKMMKMTKMKKIKKLIVRKKNESCYIRWFILS